MNSHSFPFANASVAWSDTTEINRYLAFRQTFAAEEIAPLTLYIRAHSNYLFFLNKQLIGFGQYPDYDHHRVYDTLTVPAEILARENTIDLLVYCQGESSSTYRKGKPGLIFALWQGEQLVCASGMDTRVSTATGFRSGPIEKISPQLTFTFEYDAAVSFLTNPDSSYLPAALQETDGVYFPRPVEKLQILPQIPSALLRQGGFYGKEFPSAAERISRAALLPAMDERCNGQYFIYDLSCEKAGYLTFDITLPEDCRIDIGYGEHLDDDRVRTLIGNRHFAFCYHGTQGRNRFTYYFTRIAGRYLQLHIHSKAAVTLHYVGMNEAVYPLSETDARLPLDPLEKRIYRTSLDTLRLCVHEHYEDCPWREQALYAMDSRFQMLCGYSAFGELRQPKASLQLLALSQREDGFLELCAPAEVPITIPSFSLLWIVALCDYLRQSSDTAFIREMLPVAEKILAALRFQDGLVQNPTEKPYWNFYEWSDLMDGWHGFVYPCDAALNLFYLLALQGMRALCRELGQAEQANKWQIQLDALGTRINQAFWDDDQKCYLLSTKAHHTPELIQALAVLAGIAPDKDTLLAGLRARQYQPTVLLNNQFFRYEALLSDPGNLPFVRAEIKDIWGKMLQCGATSFWETEKGADDFDRAGSLCHGWSAVPAYIYLKYCNLPQA